MENIESGAGREAAGAADEAAARPAGGEVEVSETADVSAAGSDSRAGARVAYMAGGAVLIVLVFWWLQFSTGSLCCGDFDGYYHIGFSRMLKDAMLSGMFPPPFTQLPLTTLNPQDYVDHHFLFHVMQIPATWFADPVAGGKILTLVFASLAVFSCYWLVLRYRLRQPAFWLFALLACAAPFLYRMNMTKAMSVSIVLLAAGIYLLFERRYLWLLPLAFVFALTYDMWVLLAAAAGLWALVASWTARGVEWGAWKGVGYTVAGSLLGYVINPYFPRNVRLFAEHVIMKVTRGDFTTAVGGEWYPYNTWEFLSYAGVACAAMLVGYVAFNGNDRPRSARALFLLLFSTLLLVANLRWKRFAEYWPPFAVLFAAFSVEAALDAGRAAVGRLPADVLDELQPYLDHGERPAVTDERRRERWAELMLAATGLSGMALAAGLYYYAAKTNPVAAVTLAAFGALGAVVFVVVCFLQTGFARGLLCVVALALGITAAGNIHVTARDIAESAPPEFYRGGVEWLKANVAPGEMIFNTDWDDFPRLFYFAPEYRYVSGLDPTYLQDQNPELHKLYEDITVGRVEDPGPPIRERFGARYVFTDNEHEDLVGAALESGWFDDPVYEDRHCTILRIRDVKGTPVIIPEDDAPPEDDAEEPQEP